MENRDDANLYQKISSEISAKLRSALLCENNGNTNDPESEETDSDLGNNSNENITQTERQEVFHEEKMKISSLLLDLKCKSERYHKKLLILVSCREKVEVGIGTVYKQLVLGGLMETERSELIRETFNLEQSQKFKGIIEDLELLFGDFPVTIEQAARMYHNSRESSTESLSNFVAHLWEGDGDVNPAICQVVLHAQY